MPSTSQKRPSDGETRYREGPNPKVQLPKLPERMKARFVRGQMFAHQDSLPKLPVPPLQETLKKYLERIKPLISSEEYEQTEGIVTKFAEAGGVGEVLQEKLLKRAEEKENWLSEWWRETAYLSNKMPLIVHSSVSAGFPTPSCKKIEDFARFAACFLQGCIKFQMLTMNQAIPPDFFRKQALCMVQYYTLSKFRVPAEGSDVVKSTPFDQSRHVIIARNGNFFKLDVVCEFPDGTLGLVPLWHLEKQLLSILKTTPEDCDYPVGVLTTERRDIWHKARQKLMLDPISKVSLEAIETSQLVFCLDKKITGHSKTVSNGTTNGATNGTTTNGTTTNGTTTNGTTTNGTATNGTTSHGDLKYWDERRTLIINRSLHGGGSGQHSSNRWFDCSIQVMVGEDGASGANLEHSIADGVSAIACLVRAQEVITGEDDGSSLPEASLKAFKPLQWNITPSLAQDIDLAKEKLDKLVGDVDMNVFIFTEFGKDFLKSLKISPDGFIQNAILYAYYKMYKCVAPMCESCATRMFHLGRTDFIRNTTSQAMAFIEAMQDSSVLSEVKAKLLLAAIKAHTCATLEALQGQAFDRHMLGLKVMAKESGMEVPDIFKDDTYDKTRHFQIFASQVPIPSNDLYLCFGARAWDGYGICYNPLGTQILVSVSCFRSCAETDSMCFMQALCEVLLELRDLITTTNVTPEEQP